MGQRRINQSIEASKKAQAALAEENTSLEKQIIAKSEIIKKMKEEIEQLIASNAEFKKKNKTKKDNTLGDKKEEELPKNDTKEEKIENNQDTDKESKKDVKVNADGNNANESKMQEEGTKNEQEKVDK